MKCPFNKQCQLARTREEPKQVNLTYAHTLTIESTLFIKQTNISSISFNVQGYLFGQHVKMAEHEQWSGWQVYPCFTPSDITS